MDAVAGVAHLIRRIGLDDQRHLAARCLELGANQAGFYTPVVRGTYPMSLRMLCLGRHWNARTYGYEFVRSDVDGLPVPPLPPELADLARTHAREAGFDMRPDICLINWYGAGSKLGLHQDKDESAASLERGAPVVSISLGDTAIFRLGGLRRRDLVQTVFLMSGDVFVFGGPSRLRYHGVSRILPDTAPEGLGFQGRLNLTFREY